MQEQETHTSACPAAKTGKALRLCMVTACAVLSVVLSGLLAAAVIGEVRERADEPEIAAATLSGYVLRFPENEDMLKTMTAELEKNALLTGDGLALTEIEPAAGGGMPVIDADTLFDVTKP